MQRDRFVHVDRYWPARPFVFLFVPGCQGLPGLARKMPLAKCGAISWWRALSEPWAHVGLCRAGSGSRLKTAMRASRRWLAECPLGSGTRRRWRVHRSTRVATAGCPSPGHIVTPDDRYRSVTAGRLRHRAGSRRQAPRQRRRDGGVHVLTPLS